MIEIDSRVKIGNMYKMRWTLMQIYDFCWWFGNGVILEDIYGQDGWRENGPDGFPLFLHNIFLKMVQMDFLSPSQHISYFTSLP